LPPNIAEEVAAKAAQEQATVELPAESKIQDSSPLASEQTSNSVELSVKCAGADEKQTEYKLGSVCELSQELATTKEQIDNVVSRIKRDIDKKIRDFRMKERSYLAILKGIDAERDRLVCDLTFEMEALESSVKSCLDNLQAKFYAKIMNNHISAMLTDSEVNQQSEEKSSKRKKKRKSKRRKRRLSLDKEQERAENEE